MTSPLSMMYKRYPYFTISLLPPQDFLAFFLAPMGTFQGQWELTEDLTNSMISV